MSDTSHPSSLFPPEDRNNETTHPDVAQLGKKLADLKIVAAETLHNLGGHSKFADAKTLINQLEVEGSLTTFQGELIRSGTVEDVCFDDYILMDKLGEGGMGAVYKARSTMLDRVEAIKMMTRMEDPNIKRRFQREAKLLARLEHPAIVPIYKVGRVGNTDYIAMKYVEGEELKSKVDDARKSGQLLPVHLVCRWIQRAADALAHAHSQGIIHRDIKPQNLMITHGGDLIVLDMGIARLSDPQGNAQTSAGMTVEGSGMGTPDYMPPEQWADASSVTPAADIYALGCTLFFALTGRVPFPRERLHEIMRAHAIDPAPSAHQLRPEVPIGIDKIIARMLEKEPEARYANASEVVEALAPFTRPAQDDLATIDSRADKNGNRSRTTDNGPMGTGTGPTKGAMFAAALLLLAVIGGIGTFVYVSAVKPTPGSDDPGIAKLPESDPKDVTPPVPITSDVPEVPFSSESNKASQLDSKIKSGDPIPVVPGPEPVPQWIAEFQEQNKLDWPEVDGLVGELNKLPGFESLAKSKPFFDENGLIGRETTKRRRIRIQTSATTWVEETREKNADLWATRDEFDLLVKEVGHVEELESDKQLAQWQLTISNELRNWRHPFDSIKEDTFAPGVAEKIVKTLQHLLSLHAIKRAQSWNVIAGFEDAELKRVTSAAVDERVTFWFTVTEPSYITLVQMDEHEIFAFQVLKKWNPGDAIALTEGAALSFEEPGEKRMVVYATDELPLEENLLPDELKSTISEPVAAMFPSRQTFEHVRRCLEMGKTIPSIGPSEKVGNWAHSVAKLQVREKD